MENYILIDTMKKITVFALLVSIFTFPIFSIEEKPSFLAELNTGYAFGIQLPNFFPIEAKLTYPIGRSGFTLEAGRLFDQEAKTHIFFGIPYYIIYNSKIRLPVTIGGDILISKQDAYFGIGGIVSFNYVLTKNVYIGINIEINYYMTHSYEEISGYRDAAIGVDEHGNKIYPMGPGGNPVLTMPVTEMKNHSGSYIHIKPMIGIGLQF
jgi:hypothetical protein